MPISSNRPSLFRDDEYAHEYYERNVDRSNNNEVKIRLVHATATYNAAHNIYIDYAAVSSLQVESAEEIAAAVWADPNGLTVLSDLAFIKNIEAGRWVISAGQMIFYQDDNITEVARFNLTYDANMNPIERVRI